MAYDATKLFRMSNAGPTQVFIYSDTEAIGTVDNDDYFLTSRDDAKLEVGDVIIVCDTNTPTVDILMVTVSDASNLNTVLLS